MKNPDTTQASKATRQAKPKTDRFGKPISRHFTTQGFPRLRLYREMQAQAKETG